MTDFAYAPQHLDPLQAPGIGPAIRYAGVLLVWLAFTAIAPRRGWEIFRSTRADSPMRRRIWK